MATLQNVTKNIKKLKFKHSKNEDSDLTTRDVSSVWDPLQAHKVG